MINRITNIILSVMKKRARGRPNKGKDAKTIPIIVKLSAREVMAFRKEATRAGKAFGPWLLEPRRKEFGL